MAPFIVAERKVVGEGIEIYIYIYINWERGFGDEDQSTERYVRLRVRMIRQCKSNGMWGFESFVFLLLNFVGDLLP